MINYLKIIRNDDDLETKKQLLNIIRQQHYLQVACNDVWTVSLSGRPACMFLYLANDYLLATEDVLSFGII